MLKYSMERGTVTQVLINNNAPNNNYILQIR